MQSVVDKWSDTCLTLQTGFSLCLEVNTSVYILINAVKSEETVLNTYEVAGELSFNGEPWGVFE